MGSELKPPTAEQEALLYTLRPELVFAPTILIQTLVKLADVSFWQSVIDFVRMKASGLAGVIIRAGQNTWEDTKFKINWLLARAAGIPRGSYWFYDSRKTPKEQAELWWSLIKGDTGELVHVADFEESYGGPYGSRAHLREFLARFQQLSGLLDHRIAIYTGFFWAVERLGGDPFFKRFQLWLASYGSMAAARIPAPWSATDLLFWQFTASGDGPEHGVSSQEIDLNWYCCDLVAYGIRFPLAAGEPPQGEPMPDYFFSITPYFSDGCRIRPEPDTGNTPLATKLLYGQTAYGNRRVTIAEDRWEDINGVRTQVNMAGDVWLEVVLVNGQPLLTPHYIAEIHKGQRVATITQIGTPTDPPPTPTPTIPDLPVMIILGDDVTYEKQTINTTMKPKA
jgi:GH25 family lysozyme M1 (1,4-beta-N-acetylmuramidase)